MYWNAEIFPCDVILLQFIT